jgi:nucleoid DNA-binding protein
MKRIVDRVVLDTGCSRALIGKIVESFLGHYQEIVGEGGSVYINGFGEMNVEVRPRRYWDINRGVQDDISVSRNPKVRFTPSKEFMRYITVSDN